MKAGNAIKKLIYENLNIITDHIQHAFLWLDDSGKVLDAYSTLDVSLWEKGKRVRGASLYDMKAGVLSEEMADALKRVSRTGEEVMIFSAPVIRMKQEYRLLLRFFPHSEGRMCLLIQDITRIREDRQRSRFDELELEYLNNYADDLIYRLDAYGHFTYCNRAVERVMGFQPADVVGKFYLDYVHPDFREEVARHYILQFKDRIPNTHLEYPVSTKSGGWSWLEQNVQIIMDGKWVVGFQGIGRNITERKNAEDLLKKAKKDLEEKFEERTAELRKINDSLKREISNRIKAEKDLKTSERHLADIINYLPDATFVIDRKARVIAWNKAIEDLTGFPREQMVGKGDYEYALPFYGERKPILVDYVLHQDRNIEEKYSVMQMEGDAPIAETYITHLRPEGSYLWEQAKPLYDSEGRVIGCIETVRDLTERKQAEETLRTITKQVLYHQLALQSLSRIDTSDYGSAVKRITEVSARTLDVNRVVVWNLCDESGSLICSDMHAEGDAVAPSGVTVESRECPLFIKKLEDLRILAANDACGDERLAEFADSYLKPLHITSVMHAPIRLRGGAVGVVSFENTGQSREWSLEEQDFAISIADMVALSMEASERRRAEEALQEQIRFTENLIENFAVAAFVIDAGGRVMLWNRACEVLTGIGSESIIRTSDQWKAFYDRRRPTLADIVVNQDFKNMGQLYQDHSQSVFIKNGWHAEGWYDNLGGQRRFMIFDAVPILNQKGDVVAAVETLQDITALKNAEQEMQRMRTFLKNIIDSMPSILVGVDTEGRVIHWNQEAEKVTRVAEKDAQGRQLGDIYPLLKEQMANVQKAIAERRPQRVERLQHRLDGDILFSDVMVYPLVANGVEGAVIRVDDVTSRVRIEEMMVQTEKMMSVGGLAAGMAHEINNPLGGIMLGAQNVFRRISLELPQNRRIAEECGVDLEKVRVYMERREIIKMLQGILTMGERASKIVSNMLSFSRRSESRMGIASMPDLVDKTIELAANDYDLKKKYDFRHIEIVREYEADLPEVSCVATEIQQVVLNLLKNAAQAMREKTYDQDNPRIVIRIKREGHRIRLEIQDNGPGMDDKIKKRVFEPFFTTKEVGSGTGLGLSVSYFIITDNHKGSMALTSSPGKGVTFIIHLPLERRLA